MTCAEDDADIQTETETTSLIPTETSLWLAIGTIGQGQFPTFGIQFPISSVNVTS